MPSVLHVPNTGDLVKVSWVDADCDAGWHPHDPKADDIVELTHSYGLLVTLGENFVVISHCHNPDSNDWLSKHRIPNGMVMELKVIASAEELR